MTLPAAHEISIAILIKVFCTLAAEEHEQNLAKQSALTSARDGSGEENETPARSALLQGLNRFLLEEVQTLHSVFSSTLLSFCEKLQSHVRKYCQSDDTGHGTITGATESMLLQIVDRLQDILQDIDVPDDLFDLFAHFEDLLLAPGTKSSLVPYSTTIQHNEAEGVAVMLVVMIDLTSEAMRCDAIDVKHPSSVLGLFLRKLHLSFSKLTFAEVVRLTEEVHSYINESMDQTGAENAQGEEEEGSDSSDERGRPNAMPTRFANPILAESYIFELVQKNETGARDSPTGDDLLRVIKNFERNYAHLAKLHYLRFLYHRDQWEWQPAVDCLHRYFDLCYSYIDRDGNYMSLDNMSRNPGIVASYCLLNLATLHYKFGHLDASLEMIHDLVSNAQERNEHECLVLTFALLYRISQDKGASHEATQRLVKRCALRAKELGMHEQVSEAYITSARQRTLTNAKLMPSEIENFQHFTALHVWRDLRECAQVNSEHALTSMESSSKLARGTAWQYFGNKTASTKYILSASRDAKLSEHDQLIVRCNLATHLCAEGQYAAALEQLANTSAKQRDELAWRITLYGIGFDHSFGASNMSKAETILTVLDEMTQSPISLANELESRVDMYLYRRIKFLLEQGHLHEAKRLTEDCLELCTLGSQDLRSVKFLHQLAMVHMKSYSPARALKPLLMALDICEKKDSISLYSQTIVLMADVSISLSPSNYGKAIKRLESVMHHVMQHGYPIDKGRAFALRARCKYQQLHHQGMQNDGIEEVAYWFQKAQQEFQRVGSLYDVQSVLQETVQLWDTTSKYDMMEMAAERLDAVNSLLQQQYKSGGGRDGFDTARGSPLEHAREPTEFLQQEMRSLAG